ncbi:uncharacterized protein [Miscanthus floridulus]|uniref:uncharacterized protein n=1 Tax=Miscanthus floridulus TaxID=154761 RepID=UPI00345ACEAE
MDMSGGGHGSLQPVWKPNWLRTDLVDYSSSTSSSGGGTTTTTSTTTTTTTTGTATSLSTPTDEMASLVSYKQGELDEAIWNMMEETSRTRLTEDDDGSWRGVQTPQGSSPDIHELTRAMVSYIVLLSTNWATAHQLVKEAAQLRGYVPSFDKLSPTLVMESHMAGLARKIENYIETYLQVSWAPVLSCLYNSTPLCMGRYSSPAKFESEFQKTYNAQKFWKVPDPKLRRRLRVAVIDKVISSFEKYLEYSGISPSRITPYTSVPPTSIARSQRQRAARSDVLGWPSPASRPAVSLLSVVRSSSFAMLGLV